MKSTVIQTASERIYTVSFHKTGSKAHYGFNVVVTGDKKAKVMREAQDMLEQIQGLAIEAHKRYFGDIPEVPEKPEKPEKEEE